MDTGITLPPLLVIHRTRNSLMRIFLLRLVLIVSLFCASLAAQKGGTDITGDYEPVAVWPGPFARPGYIQGAQAGVFAESPNRIFIMNRGEVKTPEKPPATYNGSWPSANPGEHAARAEADARNFILVYDGKGKLI